MSIFQCLKRGFGCENTIKSLTELNDTLSMQETKTIEKLRAELNNYQKQIDYSFMPAEWKLIDIDVTTTKTQEDGIDIKLDIRDLLNTTIYSRRHASEVISKIGLKTDFESYDEYFNRIALAVANLIIESITYRTNQDQFNVMDRWNNGDTALETGLGDCDISSRCFVRIMNDALDYLKMFEYKKYVFQVVGYYTNGKNKYGHSWAMVYNPIKKKFDLIECTLDNALTELPTDNSKYEKYFVLNFKSIFAVNNSWRIFL